MDSSGGQPCVGVFPRAARAQRNRMFDTLEQALEVRFVGRDYGEERALSAAIVWRDRDGRSAAGTLSALPQLTICADGDRAGELRPLRLHNVSALDARLRGLEVNEPGAASCLDPGPSPSEQTIASTEGCAVWVVDRDRGAHQRLAVGIAELEAGEVLRDRFRNGRLLGLLPILELARRVRDERHWRAPALRACFLFDDPNLHWPSYGHLDYGNLADDAERHGYHVAMATIPLDGWLVDPRAAEVFGRYPGALSLIVHGNDHIRGELARVRTAEGAESLARQALARIARLERRARLPVGRIMAPPHGVCSEQMARALLRTGFEALTVSRAYPWLSHPPADRPLAGWRPAEFVAGGLPVIERRPLGTVPAELALLAYLDHPLILYGHHRDVAEGPARLGRIADRLGELGSVRWGSMQGIARANFSQRRDGDVLHVRMYSRRIDLEVPAGVEQLVIELPGHPHPDDELILCGGELFALGEPVPAPRGGSCQVALRNTLQTEPSPDAGRRRRVGVWPRVRRGMTEARDRSVTIVDRLAARRA